MTTQPTLKRYTGNRMCLLPLWSTTALLLSSGCGSEHSTKSPMTFGTISVSVLNGEDNRQDWFELDDELLRERVSQEVAAMLWVHRVRVEGARVFIEAETLQEALHVCPGERFAEQPSAAFCTATLVDNELMLTAGHCLGDTLEAAQDRCPRVSFVFGYHIDGPAMVGPAGSASVFRCRQVIHHEHHTAGTGFRDLAFIQLDRQPIGPPAPVTMETPHPGDEVMLASHGAGLPLKIEQHATVTEVFDTEGHFIAATDSYVGGSGGAILNNEQQFMGHQVRGAVDWQSNGDCLRSAQADTPVEQHQSVRVAIDALCATGWPSEALCGTGPICGDSFCTNTEDAASCPRDCPSARCGDGRCDGIEAGTCGVDCDDYADVPFDWNGDPQVYRLLRDSDGDPSSTFAGTNVETSAAPEPAGCQLSQGRKPISVVMFALILLTAIRRRATSGLFKLGPRAWSQTTS